MVRAAFSWLSMCATSREPQRSLGADQDGAECMVMRETGDSAQGHGVAGADRSADDALQAVRVSARMVLHGQSSLSGLIV
jgi:hypothetical protein